MYTIWQKIVQGVSARIVDSARIGYIGGNICKHILKVLLIFCPNIAEGIICKFLVVNMLCCAPLHEEWPKYHGHKGDPRVTLGTCAAIGERAQVILLWLRAPGVGNASHSRRLRVTRVRTWAMCRLWRGDSRMLKNTPIRGVRWEIRQFEWGVVSGQRPRTYLA